MQSMLLGPAGRVALVGRRVNSDLPSDSSSSSYNSMERVSPTPLHDEVGACKFMNIQIKLKAMYYLLRDNSLHRYTFQSIFFKRPFSRNKTSVAFSARSLTNISCLCSCLTQSEPLALIINVRFMTPPMPLLNRLSMHDYILELQFTFLLEPLR